MNIDSKQHTWERNYGKILARRKTGWYRRPALKKWGNVQKENIFSASKQKLTAMPIYRTFFVWEFISPAESPVAGGWRMVFKGTTLDPDSNCNWVITKLSTLFAKLECEAFNSKVTFYITFILHFLHLLPPSL